MKFTTEEIARIIDKMQYAKIVSFAGATVVMAHFNFTDRKSSFYEIYVHDMPICTVAFHKKNMESITVTVNKYEEWESTEEIGELTEKSLLLILMAVQVRFDENISYAFLYDMLEETLKVPFLY